MLAILLSVVLPCFSPGVDPPAAVSLAPSVSPSVSLSASPSAAPTAFDDQDEYKQKRAAAGSDVKKLWALVDWCEARGMQKERKSCLRLIVRQEPDDEKARGLLGHVYYDGKWFTTEKKLEQYKADQAKARAKEQEKEAKAQGLVRFGDRWVDPAHLPYLEQGLVQNEYGEWIDPIAVQRLADGWVQQDLVWIAPEEQSNLKKGLWKCGDKWLSEADANAYHAELFRWWEIPTDHYILQTTTDRKSAETIAKAIDETYGDLMRLFGTAPVGKPHVVVLRSLDQYNRFAGGDESFGVPPTEGTGWSSANSIYFADAWFDDDRNFLGAGVTYWNADDENDVRFANHWVRHAAGLSFIEGLDPSPEAIATVQAGSNARMARFVADFWKEKLLPLWIRYGAATYVERYYIARYDNDKLWVRNWSVGNILNRGGLDPIGTILDFRIDLSSPESAAASEKLFNESGLLWAFVLDGANTDVKAKHGAFKAALKAVRTADSKEARKALEGAIRDLGDALRANETELRTFGGL